jgi:glucose-1-phosphate adenylyltransferase
MRNVVALILGGGRGTRLYPLTKLRAKPAVPLAGKYRLIDIPISNCINSGIQKIYVLTQFNSASLNRHISGTYQFSPFGEGFVEILAAQQTPEHSNWFQGTADAVRQYLPTLKSQKIDEILVLSGDHLYRMDYRPFLQHHQYTNADATLSVIPVSAEAAPNFGIVKIDTAGRVIEFREKPTGKALQGMRADAKSIVLDNEIIARAPYFASMGIYVFKREALFEMLMRNPEQTDFSKEIIPVSLQDFNVQAYSFKDYWEDIGTVEAFYQANMGLVKEPFPAFSFFDAKSPIYSRPRFLPPTKILDSHVEESMISEGCIIKNAEIRHSIIGIRTRLEANTTIEHTLVMGADFYQSPEEREADQAAGIPPVGIGANSHIRNAIIDKNARIGNNVKIINRKKTLDAAFEHLGYWISSGIVIIIKDANIPNGTVI